MTTSLSRSNLNALRPNAGWGVIFWNGILYVIITIFAAAVLFRAYVLPLDLGVFGVKVPPIVYLAAIAFIGYRVQHHLSAAYGGRRVADLIVSTPMLVVIALSIAVWAGLPIVQTVALAVSSWIGYPIESTPNEYKLAAVIFFGIAALLDVVGRDILGIGRRSQYAFPEAGSVALSSVPPEGGYPPGHEPKLLPSRTGLAEYVAEMPVDIVPVFRIRRPDGTYIVAKPTPRIDNRVIDQNGGGGDDQDTGRTG